MLNSNVETTTSSLQLLNKPISYAVLNAALHISILQIIPHITKNGNSHVNTMFTQRVISTIHALIAGSTAACLIGSGTFYKDTVSPFNATLDHLFSYYAGYSLYDCVLMATTISEPLSMWTHHLLGIAGSFTALYYKQALFFPTAFMISELSVIPINWVWMIQHLPPSKSGQPRPILKIALMMRAFFFLIFRTPIGIISIKYALTQHKTTLYNFYVNVLAHLPLLVRSGIVCNVSIFTILNFIWTFQALKRIST